MLVETTGDRRRDVPLHVIGGQGVFVKEVQQAVLDGRADAAVHSAKDLPSLAHPGLIDRGVHPPARCRRRTDRSAARRARGRRHSRDGFGPPASAARRGAAGPAVRRAARQHRHPARAHSRRWRHRHGRRRPRGARAHRPCRRTPARRAVRAGRRPGMRRRRVPGRRRRPPRARSVASTTPRPATPWRSNGPSSSGSEPDARSRSAPTSAGRTLFTFFAGERHISREVHELRLDDGDRRRGPLGGGGLPGVKARIGLTRPAPGALGDRLAALGATVVHVPLIEIADAPALRRRWLDSTRSTGSSSRPSTVPSASARLRQHIRRCDSPPSGRPRRLRWPTLPGRPVDLVPALAQAEGLLAEFPPPPARVLVAQADRARRVLADGLAAAGHAVESVAAYRTVVRTPDADEVERLRTVDAVVFASGSARPAGPRRSARQRHRWSWRSVRSRPIAARRLGPRRHPRRRAHPMTTPSSTSWPEPYHEGDARAVPDRSPAAAATDHRPARPRRRDIGAHERSRRPAVRARGR